MSEDARGGEAEWPGIEQLMSKLEQSPLGPMLRDERSMDRMLCDLMDESDSRVMREMGRELRDGNVSWQGLGEIEAYREVLESGAERIGEIDLGEMSEQLDEVVAEHEQAEPAEPDAGSDDEEEPGDLWQGFGRPLGGQ